MSETLQTDESISDETAIGMRAKWDTLLGPQRIWLHIALFVLTFFTTCVAGVEWSGAHDPFDLGNLHLGVEYASLLLLFLSAHEFGHFIAARMHSVEATLPYYIPFPGFAFGSINFGTFGAVIRTRSRVPSDRAMFDIGVAGPIAGFIVCCIILAVGFATLPGIEYLQRIHPGFPNMHSPAGGVELRFGKTILYSLFESVFSNPHGYIPPMTEVYHYPMLCVGWFGLFVTALNLLPVGQLDGGHLTYTLLGHRVHRMIGYVVVSILFIISLPEVLLGLLEPNAPAWLASIAIQGGSTWIVWALLTTFVIRFHHPPTLDDTPLDLRRAVIGYTTIGIFILCFTPSPLIIV